jgi:hypothetical protein
MGQSANCNAKLGSATGEGVAELETDFIQFRSEGLRFKFKLAELTQVTAASGQLQLTTAGGVATLQLGEKAADRWADKILNPPSRLEKLGIEPMHSLLLEGDFDAVFLKEVKRNPVAPIKTCDFVLLAAGTRDDLSAIATLAKRMPSSAGLWVVYPKGVQQIRETDVIAAGRAAGLKDVKVMRFSERDTALKFVVPLAARKSK